MACAASATVKSTLPQTLATLRSGAFFQGGNVGGQSAPSALVHPRLVVVGTSPTREASGTWGVLSVIVVLQVRKRLAFRRQASSPCPKTLFADLSQVWPQPSPCLHEAAPKVCEDWPPPMSYLSRDAHKPCGDQEKAIEGMVTRLVHGDKFVTLKGATGTGKTNVMAHVIDQLRMSALILEPNKELAKQIYENLKAYLDSSKVDVVLLMSPFKEYRPACVQLVKTANRNGRAAPKLVRPRHKVDPEVALLREQAIEAVKPQRTVVMVATTSAIFPGMLPGEWDYSVPEEHRETVCNEIMRALQDHLVTFEGDDDACLRIKHGVMLDIDEISQSGTCDDMLNKYSAFLPQVQKTMVDRFKEAYGENWVVFLDESHETLKSLKVPAAGSCTQWGKFVLHGYRLPRESGGPLSLQEFIDKSARTIFVSATPGEYEQTHSNGSQVDMVIRPTHILDPDIFDKTGIFENDYQELEDMIAETESTLARGGQVLINCLTKAHAEVLSNRFNIALKKRIGIEARAACIHGDKTLDERRQTLNEFGSKQICVLIGIKLLREGLDFPNVQLVIILDAGTPSFLRTCPDLTQMAGRAARNTRGRVILYGPKRSDATVQLISDTQMRRRIQQEYNGLNATTPKDIPWEPRSNDTPTDTNADNQASQPQLRTTPAQVTRPHRDRRQFEWEDLNDEQLIGIVVLMGVDLDYMSGVCGIGPCIATALLREFGTLDKLLGALKDSADDDGARKRLFGVKGIGPKRYRVLFDNIKAMKTEFTALKLERSYNLGSDKRAQGSHAPSSREELIEYVFYPSRS